MDDATIKTTQRDNAVITTEGNAPPGRIKLVVIPSGTEAASRDPRCVTFKLLRQDPSVRAGRAISLGMTDTVVLL
jgi:hypothetical protein